MGNFEGFEEFCEKIRVYDAGKQKFWRKMMWLGIGQFVCVVILGACAYVRLMGIA